MARDPQTVLDALRDAVRGTPYAGRLYVVGGYVRDRVLGETAPSGDLDIVLEGDAPALAQFLFEQGTASRRPVTYPRFGTAMLHIAGVEVELVTARAESYDPNSRKPGAVRPASLHDDALRRDFTVNTLLLSVDTGDIVDPLGTAQADIDAKLLRTPHQSPRHVRRRPFADAAGGAVRVAPRLCHPPRYLEGDASKRRPPVHCQCRAGAGRVQ